ncbi:MAG: 16S rRNA (adenine(1518)-N(6)/adenine(1519)-N(6))-dimethyltransferase RsmA [Acidithiobacillales bacterium]
MPAVRASRRGRFRPRHGQHFLTDPSTVRRILDALGAAGGAVVMEIGSGRGALTLPLLERGARVVAFEIDDRLATTLRTASAGRPLALYTADALEVDVGAALAMADAMPPVPLVGNLPYESATPMLRAFVRRRDLFSRLVVMIQKEVADRLLARPGEAAYGFLTLDVGAHARARRLFDVPPGAFSPRPRVTSSVVELVPREPAAGTDAALTVASAAFSTRRKTLLNCLTPRWGRSRAAAALERLGLPPLARGEELSLSRFRELSEALESPSPEG